MERRIFTAIHYIRQAAYIIAGAAFLAAILGWSLADVSFETVVVASLVLIVVRVFDINPHVHFAPVIVETELLREAIAELTSDDDDV